MQTSTAITNDVEAAAGIGQRTKELFDQHRLAVYRQTDRIFLILMPLQWIAGIIFALAVSPQSWVGQNSQTHLHVWLALFLGGAINLFPILFAWLRPGHLLSRDVIAVSHMLMSAFL